MIWSAISSSSKFQALLPLKNFADWISARREQKVPTSKRYILGKKGRKSKSMLFFHFMTTFYNFALKTETSKVSRVVKPTSETGNPNVNV